MELIARSRPRIAGAGSIPTGRAPVRESWRAPFARAGTHRPRPIDQLRRRTRAGQPVDGTDERQHALLRRHRLLDSRAGRSCCSGKAILGSALVLGSFPFVPPRVATGYRFLPSICGLF